MYAFKSGGALVMTLAAMACSTASAAAQQRQARQPVLPQTPNDDLRLETELGFEYRLSPQWRLRLDFKLALDHDVSRARTWSSARAWNMRSRRTGPFRGLRPVPALYDTDPCAARPFQDIAYGMDFGHLALANRVRMEELFFDTSGALLLRARYRLSAQHPISDSPWPSWCRTNSTSTSRPTARAAAPVSTGTNSTAGDSDIGRAPSYQPDTVHHGGTDRRPQRIPHDQAGLRLRPQLRTAAAVPG